MLSFCFCWDAQISREKTCADLKKIYIEGSERYPYLQGGPVLFLVISQHVFKFIGKKTIVGGKAFRLFKKNITFYFHRVCQNHVV